MNLIEKMYAIFVSFDIYECYNMKINGASLLQIHSSTVFVVVAFTFRALRVLEFALSRCPLVPPR